MLSRSEIREISEISERALSAVEPNCWSHRGNGGKRPVFPFLFPQCTTSKMQDDPAVREWNLAESCDPCKSLPVLTAAPAFQRAFRSAPYPHTTGSRQFGHCLWRDMGRRSTWFGIVQFALQHAVKVGVNHVFSSYQNVRNLALGMIAPDEPKITPP